MEKESELITKKRARAREFTYILGHPMVLLSSISSAFRLASRLRSIAPCTEKDSHMFLNEARSFTKSLSYQESRIGWLHRFHYIVIYVMCRLIQPKTVVETGVAAGYSSTCILEAMRLNGVGKLYSIDLPIYAPRYDADGNLDLSVIPKWLSSGYAIPLSLRKNWTLIIGKSEDHLERLLKSLGEIDILLHDSEHSYSNMFWEYSTSWPFIRKGGLLLSDDITLNNAFQDFCNKNNLAYTILFNLGIIRK